jgi:hypothetical protein
MKKVFQKKLQTTRKKVSKQWSKYRKAKQKVIHNKRYPEVVKNELLQELRNITKENVKIQYEDYRGFKNSLIHHSPFEGFSFEKKLKTINTNQEFYKARRNYNISDLDSQIKDILSKSNVKSVLLIARVKDEDTELIHYASEAINKPLLEKLLRNRKGNTVLYDHLSYKLLNAKSLQEFELKGIYIRIIYAKSSSNQTKN